MSAVDTRPSEQQVWRWLADIPDPEIPAISIVDLGIVREVRWDEQAQPPRLVVALTPTYSGCPATEVIAGAVREALARGGVEHAVLETRLSPAWTTDWLTPEARERLRAYGIAPPGEHVIDASRILRRKDPAPAIACPRCGSTHTQVTSAFGSTPCKALHRCLDCLEPFDYFKPH